jgi:membrane-associated HD superfamily phosphohydrolase
MLVSISMLWLGDKLNASEMVFTRFLAKGQATLTSQIHDVSVAGDRITVVLAKPKPADKGRHAMQQGRWKAVAQRGCQASRKALGWLARTTLQTIAAMTLITLLQSFFHIGMLPVVELVTMTLSPKASAT